MSVEMLDELSELRAELAHADDLVDRLITENMAYEAQIKTLGTEVQRLRQRTRCHCRAQAQVRVRPAW